MSEQPQMHIEARMESFRERISHQTSLINGLFDEIARLNERILPIEQERAVSGLADLLAPVVDADLSARLDALETRIKELDETDQDLERIMVLLSNRMTCCQARRTVLSLHGPQGEQPNDQIQVSLSRQEWAEAERLKRLGAQLEQLPLGYALARVAYGWKVIDRNGIGVSGETAAGALSEAAVTP